MIIMDLSQVLIASMMSTIGHSEEIDLPLFRHLALDSIRSNKKKFENDFGELVIASDSRSWRYDVFPYYKVRRRRTDPSKPQKKIIDWVRVRECMATVTGELRENFPYRVVAAPGAEADDVIGTIAHAVKEDEKILIISGDQDFVQCQKYRTVQQWSPHEKKWVRHDDPASALKEKIIRGCSGDDIPSILSPDDVFANRIRQKPMTAKKLAEFMMGEPDSYDTLERERFRRNQRLIDLSFSPPEVKQGVMQSFSAEAGKGRKKIFNYMVQNRLKNLMENMGDF